MRSCELVWAHCALTPALTPTHFVVGLLRACGPLPGSPDPFAGLEIACFTQHETCWGQLVCCFFLLVQRSLVCPVLMEEREGIVCHNAEV